MTSVFALNTIFTGFTLDGQPFQPIGLRVSNSLISDAETQQLINNMPLLASYGINSYSVFFQGSRYGDIAGYKQNGELDPIYAERMGDIIEAADAHGAIVVVGCLYYGDSDGWWPSWDQRDANEAIANTTQWLADHQYYNVIIDVDNEHMSPFDDTQLIAASNGVDPRFIIGASGENLPWNADIAMHLNPKVPGYAYVETEGMPGDWAMHWAHNLGPENYREAGIYSDFLKADWLADTAAALNAGEGYMAAGPWLQAAPPLGPNPFAGGSGTHADPGMNFWFDFVKEWTDGAPPPPPPPPEQPLFATLINADTNGDIGFLADGDILDFSFLGTQNLSIRADPWSDTARSVEFDLDGIKHVESIVPYAIAGDDPQWDYNAWTPSSGSHTLTLTPFSEQWGGGIAGLPTVIHFEVL